MPGSATLLDNLVDDLLPTIDDLRGDLHPAFGVRQFRVFAVTRTFPGDEDADGDVGCRGGDGDNGSGSNNPLYSELELLPQPLLVEDRGGIEFVLSKIGREEEGELIMKEVSLTYTEPELTGGALAANQQFYFRVIDAYGQDIQPRFYVAKAPPYPDRIKDIGWKIHLKRAEITE